MNTSPDSTPAKPAAREAAAETALILARSVARSVMPAAVVAVIMGGSQALSRSVYSQMIPKGQEAEYFSVYEVSDKGTSWLGPLLFGLALQFTGSYRAAILSLVVFFIAGLLLLLKVNVHEGRRQAADDQR